MTGVRSPVGPRPAAPSGWSPPTIDSLDPQRSYLPGVWNLMRLYTRTLVTYSSEPGETDQLVPDLATDLGTPSEDGLSWTFTLKRGGALRDRPADHLARRQVRDRAHLRLRRDPRRPELRRRPARRPGQPLRRPVPGRGAGPSRTGRRRDPRRPHDRLPAPGTAAGPPVRPVAAVEQPGAQRERQRRWVRRRPRLLGPVRDHVRRPGDGHPAGPQHASGTPPPTRSAPPCPTAIVVRTGLSGLERDQAVLAGSADIDLSGTGVQPATTSRLAEEDDNPLRERADELTTGAIRMLALPTDVAPMDNPACRTAVAVGDRPAGDPGGAERAGRRGAQLPAVAAGAARRARGRRTRGPTSPPPGPRWRTADSRTASTPCSRCPTRRPACRSPRSCRTSSPRSGSRRR